MFYKLKKLRSSVYRKTDAGVPVTDLFNCIIRKLRSPELSVPRSVVTVHTSGVTSNDYSP